MNTLIVAIVSIGLSVAAQFSLKAGMSSDSVRRVLYEPYTPESLLKLATNRYILLGFFLYGLGAIVWLRVLSAWDVSKAYPLVGLGFALTVAIGFMRGEHVDMQRALGVALIAAGVYMVGRS